MLRGASSGPFGGTNDGRGNFPSQAKSHRISWSKRSLVGRRRLGQSRQHSVEQSVEIKSALPATAKTSLRSEAATRSSSCKYLRLERRRGASSRTSEMEE